MKKIFAFLVIVLTSTMLAAQNKQQGYVKTRGRLASNGTVIHGQRLSGASVVLKGGNTVVSGSNGNFSILLPTKQYYLQNIQKQGYVVADPDILSRQYSYSANPIVLVMETPDNQTEDKLMAERKIRRTLQRQLQDKEDELETLREQNKITREEYQKALQTLYGDEESNDMLIGEMVERYSTIDYDQLDEFNLKVSQLILDGKLTEADSLINSKGDIIKRAEALHKRQNANAKEEQELKKLSRKLAKSKELTQKELDDIALDCYSKFEIFKMQHINDSAAYYLEFRANLDTTNIYWLDALADYLCDYVSDYEKAYQLNCRCMSIAEAIYSKKSAEYAMCVNNMGAFFLNLGQYVKARSYLEQARDIYLSLGDENIIRATICEHSIGSLCDDMQDYEQAILHFEKTIAILESVTNQDQKQYVNEQLGNVYNSIGLFYYKTRNYKKAEETFLKAKDVWAQNDISDKDMIIDNNMAGVMHDTGRYAEAYQIYNKIARKRIEIYGERNPKVAITFNNIASLFLDKQQYDSAFFYQAKALEIWEDAYGHMHPIVGDATGNLANILRLQNKNRKSLELFKKAYEIAMVTRGGNSISTQDLMSNIEWIMGVETDNNPQSDLVNDYAEFRKDLVYVASIPKTELSPAYQFGMQGDYYFVKYNDWDINSNKSMLIVNEQCKGKPKTLLFYKDGKLLEHNFENMIGARIYVKRVSGDDYKKIEAVYNNWKRNNH